MLFKNFYSHIPCGMWRVLTWHIPGYVAFLLTHPVWDVTKTQGKKLRNCRFLLTHPVWDVTPGSSYHGNNRRYFYSHIPCGMWLGMDTLSRTHKVFLLTHPVWDVTHHSPLLSSGLWFLLTHPVWDVTQHNLFHHFHWSISTHTSRVGCDLLPPLINRMLCISTHTSRVGCDV